MKPSPVLFVAASFARSPCAPSPPLRIWAGEWSGNVTTPMGELKLVLTFKAAGW